MDTENRKGVRSLFSLNDKAAQAFAEIAEYMQLKGENPFKVKAYVKASSALRNLEEDLAELIAQGQVQSVPGIGKSVAEKLKVFQDTGQIPQLEALRCEIPKGLLLVSRLPGLGAKKTALLHKELGVTGLDDFRDALSEGKVAELKGFSKKSQQKFLEAVESALSSVPTFIKKRLEEWGSQAQEQLGQMPGVDRVEIVGGVRRREPEGPRLPLLVLGEDPLALRKSLLSRLTEEGLEVESEESEVIYCHPSGCPIRVAFANTENAGWELLQQTGPESFAEAIRTRGEGAQACQEESQILEALGMPLVPPEVRHRPECWNSVPELLQVEQLRGNLHAHSTYSDGRNTILEMVEHAGRLGHEYFGLSDHSRSLVIANGLTIEQLQVQRKELEQLRDRFAGLTVFAGIECDILEDGSRDYPDLVLDDLDYVIAAVHSFFHLNKAQMTERILSGLAHPKVKLLAHPTGRLLSKRSGYEADWTQIFSYCRQRRIALEINASPWRLDIAEELLDLARETGCLISINTDAHSTDELENAVHGVDMARRATIPVTQVVNTWPLEKIQSWFNESTL